MKIQYIPCSFSCFHHIKPPHTLINNKSWTTKLFHQTPISTPFYSYKSNISYYYAYLTKCQLQRDGSKLKRSSKKQSKGDDLSTEVAISCEKKGTISGAVALIIVTNIGSGILALPMKTSPAKKVKVDNENELEVISIRTMARETLGELGGTVATLIYVFLGYTSMTAYASKSGEILYHLVKIPETVSGVFFTMLFESLVPVGGTRTTDQ